MRHKGLVLAPVAGRRQSDDLRTALPGKLRRSAVSGRDEYGSPLSSESGRPRLPEWIPSGGIVGSGIDHGNLTLAQQVSTRSAGPSLAKALRASSRQRRSDDRARTNTYLLASVRLPVPLCVIRPDDARHLESILAAAGAPIRWIVVTHTHRDHSPLTAELARQSGANHRIAAAPRRAPGRDLCGRIANRRAERLSLGDCELIAIHTPRPCVELRLLLLGKGGMLITGDHVLEGVSPVILLPDGNMADYLDSIDKFVCL